MRLFEQQTCRPVVQDRIQLYGVGRAMQVKQPHTKLARMDATRFLGESDRKSKSMPERVREVLETIRNQ